MFYYKFYNFLNIKMKVTTYKGIKKMNGQNEKIEIKEKKPGIKDVAKVAGVSSTTVSRVLNNRGYISEETKQKVHQAMKKIGYYPNEIARALLNQRTYFIGVIVPSIINPFHGEVAQNIEAYFSHQNYKMLLCNSNNNAETEKEYVEMLKRNQVDGMIVGTHNNHSDIIKEYSNLSMPLVAIDRYLGDNIVTISCDNYKVGQIATEHLLEKGCRKILCIRGDSRLKMPGNDRSQAYRDIMRKLGLPSVILEVPFVKPLQEKYKLIDDTLHTYPDLDGVFAGDDLLAAITLQIAKERGIAVPERLKIIGVDGAKQTRIYLPELTTIRQPIEEISKCAVRSMIDLIEGKKCENRLDLPVTLLEGKTT